MLKSQALKAMQNGAKITHSTFDNTEFMAYNTKLTVKFEDGVIYSLKDFFSTRTDIVWQTGWNIFRGNLVDICMAELEERQMSMAGTFNLEGTVTGRVKHSTLYEPPKDVSMAELELRQIILESQAGTLAKARAITHPRDYGSSEARLIKFFNTNK